MPNIIKPKRSYTATNTPTLASGELGINAADGKIYLGNAAGSANVLVASLSLSDMTGSVTSATKATNLAGGNSTTLLGSIGYQSSTDTTTLLSPNTTTTKKFLRQTGTGTNGAAPVWDTLPSALPVTNFSGSVISVSVSNGSLPVLLFGGVTTVQVTVT
jgi:hypothetical protein